MEKGYIWQGEYGKRSHLKPLFKELLKEQDTSSLEMMAIFVNNNPYNFEFYIAIIEFYIHNNSFPKLYSEYFKRIVIDPHFMNKHKFTLKIVQTVITNMPKCFVRIVFNYFFEIRIINFRQRMTNYKYICHTFCVLKQRYFLLDYFRRMLGKNIFII